MAVPRLYVHDGSVAVLASGAQCRVLLRSGQGTERITLDTNSRVRGQAAQKSTHGASGLILAAAFSPSGKRFALTTDCKQLSVYDTESWQRTHEVAVPKKGVVILFSDDDRAVLIADKFGDVYRYSLMSCVVETEGSGAQEAHGDQAAGGCGAGELILGHLSMILDAVFLGGGDYLATCDRDEKIRVTRYPQSYDIQSYCLGHTKMVTRLLPLPDAVATADGGSHELLLSGGADSSVRLWDYISGRELACVNVAAVLSEPAGAGNLSIVNSLHWVPARRTAIATIEGERVLVALCVGSASSPNAESPSLHLSDIIQLDAVPWCVQVCSGCVLVLQPLAERPLIAFAVELDGELRELFQPPQQQQDDGGDVMSLSSWLAVALNDEWSLLSGAVTCGNDFYAKLEKMGVDNLPDYLQKKRERIDAAKKSSGSKRHQQHEQPQPSQQELGMPETQQERQASAMDDDGLTPAKVCRSSADAAIC